MDCPNDVASSTDHQLHTLCEVFETPYTKEATSRGVRAVKPLAQGQLVEVAHCVLVPHQEYQQHSRHTVFEHYLFHSQSKGDMLLALGLGSLFNHSSCPNLNYKVDSARLHWYDCQHEIDAMPHRTGKFLVKFFTLSCTVKPRHKYMIIRFYAVRPIEQGEELLMFYGPPQKLWFEDATAPLVSSSSDEGSDGGLSRLQL